MNAAKVLDDLKRRFPNEPEYHQAVEEVLSTIEEEYNTKFNKQYKIICLLKQECTKAKEEYIKNKNKKYVYMEENLSEIATKEIATDEKSNSAFEIFGKDLIEIK